MKKRTLKGLAVDCRGLMNKIILFWCRLRKGIDEIDLKTLRELIENSDLTSLNFGL